MRIGRDERREPEGYEMRFAAGNESCSAKRNNRGRRGCAERGIGARRSVGRRSDDRRRRVGRHLLVAIRWRSLDLVTQQRQADRHHLAAQQQGSDESDKGNFHAGSGIYSDTPSIVTPVLPAEAGIGSIHMSRRRSQSPGFDRRTVPHLVHS